MPSMVKETTMTLSEQQIRYFDTFGYLMLPRDC